jgi:hypothetical protein
VGNSNALRDVDITYHHSHWRNERSRGPGRNHPSSPFTPKPRCPLLKTPLRLAASVTNTSSTTSTKTSTTRPFTRAPTTRPWSRGTCSAKTQPRRPARTVRSSLRIRPIHLRMVRMSLMGSRIWELVSCCYMLGVVALDGVLSDYFPFFPVNYQILRISLNN